MSTLAADTITNVAGSSAGTTITIDKDSTYNSEGTAVNQNLVQGLAKVWVKIDGTQSAGSMIQDNLNVGSMTDSSTGRHIINFTSNMNSAHYSSTAMARQDGSDDRAIIISQEEDDGTDTSNLPITTQNDGGSYVDTAGACVTIHGDLA
jgi:hypothetical protein